MLCALRQPCLHAIELASALTELGQARERLVELESELARLRRWTFGPKSERLPSIDEELRHHAEEDDANELSEVAADVELVESPVAVATDDTGAEPDAQHTSAVSLREQAASTSEAEPRGQRRKPADPAAAMRKRRANRQRRQELPTRRIPHPVPEEQRHCPKCGSDDLRALGPGKVSYIYERLKESFEREEHVQEVLACRCGECVITAPPPARVFDKAQYGPRLISDLVVSKIAEAMPLHRLSQRYKSSDFRMHRSSMVDGFHRAAELLDPLAQRLLVQVAKKEIVLGDETPIPVMAPHQTRKGWVWIFRTAEDEPLLAYVFSSSRSGETPEKVLANTVGTFLGDAYTGYNVITLPGGRERAGCMSHARRKYFEARSTTPAADEVLRQIRKLYRVEAEAKKRSVRGTAEHQRMREERSRPVMEQLKQWLERERSLHLPKGPMGKAIGYMLDNWEALSLFLKDARIPIDNNLSEAALRIIALGRKNYMWVGNEKAGRNIAGLYSLVMTCVANDIDPREYLADVLIRIQTHPNERIDELLPIEWEKRRRAAAADAKQG